VSAHGLRAVLLAALAAAAAGCQGGRGAGDAGFEAARPGRASVSPVQGLPPGWGRMRPLLERGEALALAGDTAGLLALAPSLQQEGLGLLRSNMPSTLPRHDVPRFLEGRAAFGDALVRFAQAHEDGRAADLPGLLRGLANAWRGWMAVVSGAPVEHAV
jgi:hypothetical protein